MGVPTEPVIIAEEGGLVVAGRGPEILVIDRGSGPLQITAFVLGICTLVFGGFGVVAVFTDLRMIGIVILAIGIATGVAMLLTVRAIRHKRRRILTSFIPVAVFDRAQRLYRDGSGQIIAPLDQVRFERRMQMTSSSAKLVATTPAGIYVLMRGNPFGGDVGAIDQVLTNAVRGFRY